VTELAQTTDGLHPAEGLVGGKHRIPNRRATRYRGRLRLLIPIFRSKPEGVVQRLGRRVRLVMVAAGLAAMIVSTSCSLSTSAPPTSPTGYDLKGKTVEERRQTLETLNRVSPTRVYYPGDPYAGMSLIHITTNSLGGTGPYSMFMEYATESLDRYMTITLYTPDQFARYGNVPKAAEPIPTLAVGPGDQILAAGSPRQTWLVARRPEAVVVVSGTPELGVSGLSDVAAHLASVGG
jgi:hypothetical protein